MNARNEITSRPRPVSSQALLITAPLSRRAARMVGSAKRLIMRAAKMMPKHSEMMPATAGLSLWRRSRWLRS